MPAKLGQFASRGIKFLRQNRAPFLFSLILCILSIVLYFQVYLRPRTSAFLQFLGNIELKTLDARFQLRGRRNPGPAVVIVAIDQKSQDVLGRWPFPRSDFADAVNNLKADQAKVIVFDMNFPQPDTNSGLEALQAVREDYEHLVPAPMRAKAFAAKLEARESAADNDKQFANALAHYDNAVLGYFAISRQDARAQNQERLKAFMNILSFQAYAQVIHPEYAAGKGIPETDDISPNLPDFASNAKNFGFFDLVPDPDGIVRRAPMVMSIQGNLYPSLGMAAALAYENNAADQVKLVFNPYGVQGIVMGPHTIPTDHQGFVQLDYVGGTGTFPTYSFADVVRHQVSPEVFRNRLVLIGPTAPGISGMLYVPVQEKEFPGVELHANVIDDILSQRFIRRGPNEHLIDLGFLILFSLGAGILLSVVSPVRATLILGGSLVVFFWLSYFLFERHRMWIADFLPMVTLTFTYAGIVSYRFFFEEGEKRKVLSTFSQYMHPALINQMLRTPGGLRLGGEEKELSALFSDIVGFTTLSEGLTPAQLVELLNEYLTEMTEVLFKNWGTLDKYIGDAIMAFWGAPYPQDDHALRACRTGLDMIKSLQRLQASWEERGVPRIDIGVGINTGNMLVGNMGSKRRKNFTIMGDNVNLASRLEGINRQFKTRLIISESTFLQVKGQVVARELDLIRVKGKTHPVKVFELLGMAEEAPQFTALVDGFEKGLEAYRSGQWESAIAFFQDIINDHPNDGPSQVFIKRCRDLLAQPPEGSWDGVYVMKTK